MRTVLCDMLGIRHPLCSAGMGTVATTDLVVAVSEAGGLGVLGGISFEPDELRAAIREIRNRTDRPFGVDLIVPRQLTDDQPEVRREIDLARESIPAEKYEAVGELRAMMEPGTVESQIEVVLEERPPVFASALGNPGWLCPDLHERGVTVMSLVGTTRAARACAEGGVDVIVAQGTEAGGHTGAVATLTLVPQVVDAVDVPVVAAGGIADGRALAAALCLGAAGVWMGTRFVASEEAVGHRNYKQAVVDAEAEDATISRAYSGKTMRTLRNAWVREWEAKSPAPFPFQIAASNERLTSGILGGDVESGSAPMGQAAGSIDDVRPAAEIVRETIARADAVLRDLSAVAADEG